MLKMALDEIVNLNLDEEPAIIDNEQQNAVVDEAIGQVNEPGLPDLRSIETAVPCLVSFHNSTERIVDVYWVNYKGDCVHYKSLQPGKVFPVNTFETHPWIFRDHVTRAKLLVNNQHVFLPKPYKNPVNAPSDPERPFRIGYRITIPIYSLKERAIQVVLHHIGSQENVSQLRLPETLKRELRASTVDRDTRVVSPR